jgi:hypothetical protein
MPRADPDTHGQENPQGQVPVEKGKFAGDEFAHTLRLLAAYGFHFARPFPVTLEKLDVGETVLHAMDQRLMHATTRGGERIHRPFAALTHLDQTGAAQVGQMPRDLWLRHTQQLLELTHATIPLRQQIQNAQPRLILERLKKLIGLVHVASSIKCREGRRNVCLRRLEIIECDV